MTSRIGMSPEAATVVATICCRDNGLPIGAPTSPVIANMICVSMDGDLQRLARQFGCWYTRYADDLTFSTNRRGFPPALAQLDAEDEQTYVGRELEAVVNSNGFRVNHSKSRLLGRHQRQSVTGVVTNEKPNVKREYIRTIRAMLHSWDHQGLAIAQEHFNAQDQKDRVFGGSPDFRRALRGKIEFARMVRGESDEVTTRLLAQWTNLFTGRPRMEGVPSGPDRGTDRRRLRILHMSDMHFTRSREWDQKPMLAGLATVLEQEVKPDIVVITGDIAHRGEVEEYEQARAWLDDALVQRAGVSPTDVFFVAGNHDVHRPSVTETTKELRQSLGKSGDAQQEMADAISDPQRKSNLFAHFSAYRSFVSEFRSDPSDTDLWWSRVRSKNGVTVTLTGLCSSLVAFNDEDKGHLMFGGVQVADTLPDDDTDLHVSAFHHPFSYLHDNDRRSQTDIERWSDLILHGHLHEPDLRVDQQDDNSAVIAPVGSTYQGSEYRNSVQYLDYYADRKALEVSVFAWQPGLRRRWILDRNEFQTQTGVAQFVLPPRCHASV